MRLTKLLVRFMAASKVLGEETVKGGETKETAAREQDK